MMSSSRKFYLLIFACILMFLLCYQFSFRQTIQLYSEINNLEKKNEMSDRLPFELDSIRNEINNYHSLLGNTDFSPSEIQQQILNLSTIICDKLPGIKIIEFPKLLTMNSEDAEIRISRLQLKGRFKPLLLFLNEFEKTTKSGKVISTHFEIKKNYHANIEELYLTIYIQNIKQI